MKFILFKDKANKDLSILFLSIILGAIIGFYFPNFMSSLAWIGKIFMNYLMLLVLPLIFFALVSAITSMGDIKKLGLLGKYSIITIFLNVAMAASIGLIFSLFFKPGQGVNASLLMNMNESKNQLSITQNDLTFTDFISGIFPPNLGEVAIKSEILPIVVFSVFFSIIAIKNIPKNTVQVVINACVGFKEILLEMIGFVMKVTPIAMFSLIGNAVSSSLLKGHFVEDFLAILKFIIIFLSGCVFLCLVQFLILYILMGKKSFLFLSQSFKSSITGFATSSSMATLPVMLR
jgi:Na+/H+-dicarboxylate symporter